jgi:hypothetical protein
MTTIRAIVRNGRIEVDDPIDLPDGTELTIPIPDQAESLGIRDEDWLDTPEAIDSWIRWYDSLEPVEFTSAERAAWDAARQAQKDYELSQWQQRSQRMERRFS